MSDTLIKVERVSKKFCRGLKRSLWYGMQDLGSELLGRRHAGGDGLRPDEFWAVKDVNFELKRGECLGLIGRNGAGKTTLLRMLNGLIKPDAGRIEMRGRVGALIALGAGFNPVLTGRENIYVSAAVLGLSNKEITRKLDEIIEFAELLDSIDSPVQNYSSGMVVRLGFAIAAKTEPDILLLDEVLAVGDIAFQAKCFNTLSEFRRKGTAFILVSHNMHQIERYADRVLYMKHGQIGYLGGYAAGVREYLADMRSSEGEKESGRRNWTEIYGSGKVAFTKARFVNDKGDEVSEINVGDSLSLELEYKRVSSEVKRWKIEVLARDADSVVFQSATDVTSVSSGSSEEAGRLRMRIPTVPINSGYLDFAFCAMDGMTREILDWKRGIRLTIVPDVSVNARLVVPVVWEF